MTTRWEVRVNGRVYEQSRTEERAAEIVEILGQTYGPEAVTVKKLRRAYW